MAELQRKNNFVAPGPAPIRRVTVEPEPWPETPQLPEVAHSRHVITGTPVQAAQGFSLAFAPFAATSALVAGLVATVAGAGMVTVAIVALVTLAATWLAGYVVTVIVSAAGADVLRVLLGYRFLRHEQKERHSERRGRQ